MPELSWGGRRLVGVLLTVVLVGAVLTWMALRARGADSSDHADPATSLPACADLAGTTLGPLGEDPAWNGCLTESGAAVASHRYECSGLREVVAPSGEERPLADATAVVFLPDAGLMAVTGQPWAESPNSRAAYLRTPFALLVMHRCAELRSLPHEGTVSAGCDLDDTPIDLLTTQGCRLDGEHHAAAGRTCNYTDGDQGVRWEQWSITVPGLPGPGDSSVLESGPDEQWRMVPERYRDERCSTHPDDWDAAWR